MGYTKHETVKKQKQFVSKTQRYQRKILVNIFKIFLVCIITLIIAAAGAGFGMIKGILDNAPDVDDINIVPKGFKTVIYDQDGNEVRQIATIDSNREYVYYEDIPEDYVNAFIAIEDERFWSHNGIDVKGIFRAAIKGITSGNFDEGASTLTQQLIKNHVFNVGMNETTFLDKLERKIQEQYLALELEKRYSKEEIVEYYLNTIYLGRGVHGIQAASERYFGKDMTKLTVSEIAVIAGITQNPSAYDPVIYPENNAKRRELVLDKMLELGYITETEYNRAMADDVYGRIEKVYEIQQATDSVYTYYEDAILNQLEKDFMEIYGCTRSEASTLIFTGGYSIYSVQDPEIQAICDSVINDPSYVSGMDKVGLDYALTLMLPNGELKNYSLENYIEYYKEVTGNSKYNNIYSSEQAAKAATEDFKEAMLEETDGTFYAERFSVSPQPQFSFTIMDQKTGYVKAIVGGRGKKTADRSLNRATDSPRQPGSTFKVLAAFLPFIDQDLGGLASPFKDAPYEYTNGTPVANWYGASYRGYCTIRDAIAQSLNIVSVKVITAVTPEIAFEYLIDLGFTTLVESQMGRDGVIYTDVTQSTALGGLTYGVTTFEMTAAYAAIANGGVYTKPVLYSKVVDHDGNVVIDNTTPTTKIVMKETTAWQLIDGMKSVIYGGTGGAAALRSGVKCAGKTGTTSSYFDLWFCGMTPYYTASIWMGYDYNTNMGGLNTHKYIWRDIMDQIAVMEGQDTSVDFERPSGITGIKLCKISGKSPIDGCPTVSDYCAVTGVPGGLCDGHETIELCAESGCIATEFCPEKIEVIYEPDEEDDEKFILVDPPKDANGKEYVYTEDICELHDENTNKVTITSSAGEGGTITPTVKVDIGSQVTFYMTPYVNYSIKDVIVDGQSVGAVSSYTFTDVQADATIQVIFQKAGGGGEGDSTTQSTTETPTEAPTEASTEADTTAPASETQ